MASSEVQNHVGFRIVRPQKGRIMNTENNPGAVQHQPGKLDFLIVEKDVSVTEFRRKPSAVWAYLKTVGHVIFFTRRGKRDCAIMSVETYACLSGDYEKTMREVEEAASAWRQEQKERRRARKKAQHDSPGDDEIAEAHMSHVRLKDGGKDEESILSR